MGRQSHTRVSDLGGRNSHDFIDDRNKSLIFHIAPSLCITMYRVDVLYSRLSFWYDTFLFIHGTNSSCHFWTHCGPWAPTATPYCHRKCLRHVQFEWIASRGHHRCQPRCGHGISVRCPFKSLTVTIL